MGIMVGIACCVGNKRAVATVPAEVEPTGIMTFADPAMQALCAKTWGDGTNITYEQARGVTEIPANWAKDNTEITSFNEIKYFKNLLYIREQAFTNCSNLVINEISLPNLLLIGKSAFDDCTALSSISMPSVTTIYGWAFYNSGLTGELYLPNLTSIEDRAFYKTKITSIKSLGHIIKLGVYSTYHASIHGVFGQCTLLQSVVLPQGLTHVGNYAFNNCTALETMDWMDTIEVVENAAFNNCSKWNAKATITGLKTIQQSAFYNTHNTEFVISCPNLTGSIGSRAFYNSGVTKVENLGTVERIEPYSNFSYQNGFRSSKKLTFVRLPSSLTYICSECFSSCTALKIAICEATTPPSLGDASVFNDTNNLYIYVPDESVEAYKTATNWSAYANIILPLSQYKG